MSWPCDDVLKQNQHANTLSRTTGAVVGGGVGEGVGTRVGDTGSVKESCTGTTGAPGRHCQYHSLDRAQPKPVGQQAVMKPQ